MMRAMLVVTAVGVAAGFVASRVWGGLAGVALAVLVIVLGAVVLTLRRNQEDLHELEAGRDPTPGGDPVEPYEKTTDAGRPENLP